MRISRNLLIAGISFCLLHTAPSTAQEEGDSLTLEEIIVTGRKREESLQEVPVSISVLGENLIQDAGIIDQYDLFEMVPGIHYDEFFDRNAARASVRGVQGNEVATNRTKVTAFIDGMPILGSQGSLGFNNVQQVEIYRGPQSAAFGRSTFGGAINYITRDPGDTFEGNVNLNVNDYGTRILGASIGGPVNDTLGYQLEASMEDSDAPEDYISTDGIKYGKRSGDYLSGKLVWTPDDAFTAELTFSTVELDDTPTVDYFITEAARDACAGTLGTDTVIAMGMGGGIFNIGVADCEWGQGPQFIAQNDRARFLAEGRGVPGVNDLATQVARARAAGAPGTAADIEADILAVAAAYSIPDEEVGGQNERDRATLQLDYVLDNDHAVQLSAMTSDETYIRYYDGSGNYTDALGVNYNANTGFYMVDTRNLMTIMSDPSIINEDYIEVRWVSPGENRLRYVAGAALYEYHFETLKYFDNGYGAILGGFVDEFEALTGIDQVRDVSAIIEDASNSAVFFNLSYDVTDRLTATLEGRYQSDDVSGVDPNSGNSGGISANAFIPRLSFNFNANENTSFYMQLAEGVNPGGVNTDYFNNNVGGYADTLDNGIPDGLGYSFANGNYVPTSNPACDGSPVAAANSACNSYYVDYSTDTFSTFQEEQLSNIEFGIKGTAFDGRLQYAGAVYSMAWKDQVNSVNLSWDHPDAAGGMSAEGDPVPGGGVLSPVYVTENLFADSRTFANLGDLKMQGFELEATYLINEDWDVRATFSYLDGQFDDGYCDVGSFGNGLSNVAGNPVLTPEADGVLASCNLVAGFDINLQPDITYTISPNYTMTLASGLRLNARADIRYEGEQFRDVMNVGKTPAVTTLNLSLRVSADSWNGAVYVNNVFDDATPRQFGGGNDVNILNVFGPFGLSNYSIQPRIPRTIGLRAAYSF